MTISNNDDFLSSSYEGDKVRSSLHGLSHWIVPTSLHYYYLYFTQVKTMTWRGWIICSWARSGCQPWQSDSGVHSLIHIFTWWGGCKVELYTESEVKSPKSWLNVLRWFAGKSQKLTSLGLINSVYTRAYGKGIKGRGTQISMNIRRTHDNGQGQKQLVNGVLVSDLLSMFQHHEEKNPITRYLRGQVQIKPFWNKILN